MSITRIIIALFTIGLCGLVGWYTYCYFFDTTPAQLQLQGINSQSAYTGEMSCILKSNKKGTMSLYLDETPIASQFLMNANEEYPFIIPTKTVANGSHTLKTILTDHRFAKNTTILEIPFMIDNLPLTAFMIKQEDIIKVFQGRTLRVQIQVNKPVESIIASFLSQEYPFFPESEHSLIYEVYIPIDCQETPNEYLLNATVKDKVGNTVQLETKMQVIAFPFKKHTLHVSDQKMEDEEQFGPDNQEFEKRMVELTQNSVPKKLWRGTFCAPMDIAKITCEFGTIRTTQKKGRYAHRAIDAINTPRCVVWAPQSGLVVLKERFAFTGNTVVIDHGHGILSMFCHLDSFAKIAVGDLLSQGNPIGTMGKTGYATGYHLHWEMRIGNVPVDPLQWTRISFQ